MTRPILHALSAGIGLGAVPVLLAGLLATHPRMLMSAVVALLVAAGLRLAGLCFPALDIINRNGTRRVLPAWKENE